MSRSKNNKPSPPPAIGEGDDRAIPLPHRNLINMIVRMGMVRIPVPVSDVVRLVLCFESGQVRIAHHVAAVSVSLEETVTVRRGVGHIPVRCLLRVVSVGDSVVGLFQCAICTLLGQVDPLRRLSVLRSCSSCSQRLASRHLSRCTVLLSRVPSWVQDRTWSRSETSRRRSFGGVQRTFSGGRLEPGQGVRCVGCVGWAMISEGDCAELGVCCDRHCRRRGRRGVELYSCTES